MVAERGFKWGCADGKSVPLRAPEDRPALDAGHSDAQILAIAEQWLADHVPSEWLVSAKNPSPRRDPDEYRQWYKLLGRAGLTAPQWPVEYGGHGLGDRQARVIDELLARYRLPKLNLLGLYSAAPTLLAWGSDWQKQRYLPPIATAEEMWCQLFSEPGAGSDLASLATRAVASEGGFVVNGQKVWNTGAHLADCGMLLARTDPEVPKRDGLSFLVVDMHAAGVVVRPLKQMTGESDFNEVFLIDVFVSRSNLVGPAGSGWRVARSALGGERRMVAGPGSGAVDRVGGISAADVVTLASDIDGASGGGQLAVDAAVRVEIESRIRRWANLRAREHPGEAHASASIGKLHGTELNKRVQDAAMAALGIRGVGWRTDDERTRRIVRGFLRSRANTIEGGTSEVQRTIIGERVLGLPAEPDPWAGAPWNSVPRS